MDKTLMELIQYVTTTEDYVAISNGETDSMRSEQIYRLRFEAAEARYCRMKALVCASIAKQTHLESDLKLAEFSEGLRAIPTNAVMWDLMTELKSAKSEISRLSEMNRCLRSGVAMTMPPPVLPLKSTAKLEAELTSTRKQIVAMDLELARMNNLRFEDDERIREYEDVLDIVMGHSGVVDIPAVHPRFHPMATCLDPACKKYANRLRNGMRQAVAEVRDDLLCLSTALKIDSK